jgi:hypothetical protein
MEVNGEFHAPVTVIVILTYLLTYLLHGKLIVIQIFKE